MLLLSDKQLQINSLITSITDNNKINEVAGTTNDRNLIFVLVII